MDGQAPLGGYGQLPTSAPPQKPPQPQSQPASAAAKSSARAKRVPEHQRRRAAVSCDHCKQRRAKCMRASPRDPCSNCISSRIKCQSTLPRKQRVYGSVESLSLRYRALEALVQGLLDPEARAKGPAHDGHLSDDESMLDDGTPEGPSSRAAALDIDTLYRAAAERNIPMPSRDDMTPVSDIFAASSQPTTTSAGPASGPSHHHPLPTIVQPPIPPPGTLTTISASSTTTLPPLSSMASLIPADGSVLPFQHPHPPQHQPLTTPAADEKLIPTPNGVAHYVGPSSSFRFVTSIRALVAKCGDSIITGLNGGGDIAPGAGIGGASDAGSVAGASPAAGSRGGPTPSGTGDGSPSSHAQGENQGQSSIRDQFVGLRVSKALEIQDSGSNEGDEDEGSDDSGDEAEYSGADDRDAMDGVVKGPRSSQSYSQSQSANPLPLTNLQQTIPSWHCTPGGNGGDGPTSAPSPANSRQSRPEADDASFSGTFLPPRETADIFVRVFFDRVHPNYPLFHRGSFLLRYEALWQRGQAHAAGTGSGNEPKQQAGDSGADDDYGWNCCLAMVFAFGAQALEGHDRARKAAASMQRRYLHLVCSSLSRLAGTTNLANIQALMLLQLYEHNAGRRNAAWSFLGCASRMAVALGMHRDGVVPLPADSGKGAAVNDRDARRRVWWTLYSFERNLCIMLGRPSALDETEIAVSPPTDDVQSADLPQGLPVSLLSLIRMTWKIKQLRFPAPGSQPNFYGYGFGYGNPHQTAHELLNELEAWRAALPAHLQPGWRSMIPSHRRAVLSLHIQHQYGRSLVTRQFVLNRAERCCNLVADKSDSKHLSKLPCDKDTMASDELADSCLDASERVFDYLHQLFEAGLLDGVAWIDAYYLYHSVLILCLDLVAKIVVAGHASTSAADKAALDVAIARQRASVRSILLIAQQTRLCPTFRVLVGVVCQLAAIVGALDGLLALPPPATTIDGSSLSSASSAKHHHHNNNHHHSHRHSRHAGGYRSSSSTRGRGRQRRNSSSVSSDRKTSQGPSFTSQPTASSMAAGGVSMAPSSASPQLRTASDQNVPIKSSPKLYYSPPPPTQMPSQGPSQGQYQQQHHQHQHHQHQHHQHQQQSYQQPHHILQQQHQHQPNPQHQLQIQQMQAFAGDWFTNDTGHFPWNTFDPSINIMPGNGGHPQSVQPGRAGAGGGQPHGSVGGHPASGAAAQAASSGGMISPTSTVPAVTNFYPEGIDFGMATEPATFGEDPYLSQPNFFGRQPGGPGNGVPGGPGNGNGNGHGHVPPQAYGGNMDMDQYGQQQGLNLQQQPQMDNSEWVEAWRNLSTQFHQ